MNRKRKSHMKRDPQSRAPRSRRGEQRPLTAKSAAHWLYGQHAVRAALANPRRRIERLLVSPSVMERDASALKAAASTGGHDLALELSEPTSIEELLPEGAVHQGLALSCAPLQQPSLSQLVRALPHGRQVIVALDQVTDPHNAGAIIRSAAVFGAAAVLTTDRNAPQESGLLAKTASGGFEFVPYIQETNLARSLDYLKAQDFWCLGLASEARQTLGGADLADRLILVMGAEGSGLRRLTREHCDLLLALPAKGGMRDLNVSNAAAVCLYELLGRN